MKKPSRDKVYEYLLSPILYPTQLLKKKKRPKTGLAPGSIIHTGIKWVDKTQFEVIDYTNERYDRHEINDLSELEKFKSNSAVSWINITGLHEVAVVEKLGQMFSLHRLLLEDIVDINQRPKVEEFEDHVFLTMKMIDIEGNSRKIEVEQISIVVHQNYVLCFQEKPGDIFEPIRKRLREGHGKARNRGADYLAYMLIDLIVDFYMEVLDTLYERIEFLEQQVIRRPKKAHMTEIQLLKKDIIRIRKMIAPLREAVKAISTRENNLFSEATKVYLHDTWDHMNSVMENITSYNEMVMNLMDLYLSQLSNKMNEVMKMLTLIATIFIPLTFIAGIYGMNFEYMPELQWKWAYPVGFYSLIFFVGLGMFLYMKLKRWL